MKAKKSEFFDNLRKKASATPKRIVFPEGDDLRVIEAVKIMTESKMIYPVLLGKCSVIESLCKQSALPLSELQIIDPEIESSKPLYHEELLALFKKKGLDIEEAKTLTKDRLNFGSLLVRLNQADGFVGGSVRTTADTVRAVFRIIGLSKKTPTLSSCFLMELENSQYGHNGRFVYADCAVVIKPSAAQLANIALASAQTFSDLIEAEPKVGFLSFSTKGSAKDESIDIIQQALEIVKKKNPQLAADGEFQLDAAIDADVAKKKIKDASAVAGKSNVLIFPDLNSGNIGYKITQRLAKARAVGPILQGLSKAANDLSRGCSAEDIIDVTAVTVIQAESLQKLSKIEEKVSDKN
ncbi:MAG: phosphate acetyltransferase [bacterium]